jgi:ribosomal protein S18 acetylase RimI-like enzyme
MWSILPIDNTTNMIVAQMSGYEPYKIARLTSRKSMKARGVVGHIVWRKPLNGDVEVEYLWVEPEYRGCGLGKELMNRCIKSITNNSAMTDVILTRFPLGSKVETRKEDNRKLKAFYEKFGFVNE